MLLYIQQNELGGFTLNINEELKKLNKNQKQEL